MVAALLGLLAAGFVGRWAKGLFEENIAPAPFWWDDGLGYPAMLYACALAVFAALIIGVIPALKATGRQLQGRLREASSGISTITFGGIWTGVIVTQTAITVMCLDGRLGGVLTGSLGTLDAFDRATAVLDLGGFGQVLRGTTLWAAAVTLHAAAPSGIATSARPVVLVLD